MAQTKSSQAELKGELTSIFYSAVQANMKLLINTVRMVNGAASNKGEVGDMLRDTASDAVHVMGDYLKSSVDNAVKLIDLGVNYSSRMLEQVMEKNQLQKVEPEIMAPPIEVPLSGAPGAMLSAGITIGNDKNYPVTATFRAGSFRSETGTTEPALQLTFDPPSVTLQPEEKRRVTTGIAIPENARGGEYQADVAIEGVPQIRLRFLLTVEGERGQEISISA